MVEIRLITDRDQMAAVEQLEKEIWGIPDLEVTCMHTLHALVFNGGSLFGAYAGEALVGFVLGIPALTDDISSPLAARLKLYSYMAGVRADYQGQGIGRLLKLAQRKEALRQGYQLITWTYDPLESVNAHLNIGKLGAVCRRYQRHFHGDLGGINAGLPTDRFNVDWWLARDQVEARIKGEKRPLSFSYCRRQQMPILNPLESQAPVAAPAFLVEIPTDFRRLKQQDPPLAAAWRSHSRALFEAAFAQGYTVTDFVYEREENGRSRAFYLVTSDQFSVSSEQFSVNSGQ